MSTLASGENENGDIKAVKVGTHENVADALAKFVYNGSLCGLIFLSSFFLLANKMCILHAVNTQLFACRSHVMQQEQHIEMKTN